jgi:hypothetical protein
VLLMWSNYNNDDWRLLVQKLLYPGHLHRQGCFAFESVMNGTVSTSPTCGSGGQSAVMPSMKWILPACSGSTPHFMMGSIRIRGFFMGAPFMRSGSVERPFSNGQGRPSFHLIWPELIGTEGAPPIPQTTEEAA